MIWLTWRQFRTQSLTAAAALAVLAVLLAATGPQLAHLYGTTIAGCPAHGDCLAAGNAVASQDSFLRHLGSVLVIAAPALTGIFWGAPLIAREFEAGTHRLAWSQSVTRTRWLTVKLALAGLAAMITAGLLSLMVTWWSSPLDKLSLGQMAPGTFVQRGIAPVGYAAFAFALGVTAGLLLRRTVTAMAVTLAVFAAVQVVVPRWVRPHLVSPRHSRAALNLNALNVEEIRANGQMIVTGTAAKPGAWVLSNQTITPAGRVFTGPAPQACASRTASAADCQASLARLHLRQLLSYQPAGRYWALQWRESAIFLVLALALAGLCYWQVRRRRVP